MSNGYQLLTQEEQDDIVVAYMLSQERDVYCHSLNLQRYNDMLLALSPGKFHDRIVHLRDETQYRLNEVQSIVDSTKGQMPPQARTDAALQRIKAKEGQAPSTGG